MQAPLWEPQCRHPWTHTLKDLNEQTELVPLGAQPPIHTQGPSHKDNRETPWSTESQSFRGIRLPNNTPPQCLQAGKLRDRKEKERSTAGWSSPGPAPSLQPQTGQHYLPQTKHCDRPDSSIRQFGPMRESEHMASAFKFC